MRTIASRAIAQLTAAGYWPYVLSCTEGPKGITGRLSLAVLPLLERDGRFAQGCLYSLHTDVGDCLTEFRSHTGALGKGSMQIVMDTQTGAFFADVDKFSPYSDVVGFMGHAFAEVVPGFFKGLFRRKAKEHSV